MLKELVIRNFAIIEDISISFKKGMSVFLGETGAGKSIIISAFSLLIGERGLSTYVRSGKDKAFVEASISISRDIELLEDYKIDGNNFVFTRIISLEGNSVCKINGMNVSSSFLKDTLGKIVNIYSQHDMYYLLDDKFHLSLLDKFDLDNINKFKKNYLNKYEEYNKTRFKIEELENKNINIDVEYITYQLNEILD